MLRKCAILLVALLLNGCAELKAQQRLTPGMSAEDIRARAEQGDANAQFTLGQMFEHGRGVPLSFVDAIKWYQASANQGFATAQSTLGYLYQYGELVKKDPQAAFMWNLKAAQQGDAYGQHNLAVMYDEGTGIPENDEEAVKWYKKAAEQGYDQAEFNLGVCYWKGEGVTRDYVEAYRLLNHVRVATQDQTVRWRARGILDELKKVMNEEEIKAAGGRPGSRYY